MNELEILNAEDVVESMKRGASPAQRIIEQVQNENPGKFLTLRQASQQLNVHVETLRRICRTNKVKAPSKVVKQGRMHIWLLTNSDMDELKDYFSKHDSSEDALKMGGTEGKDSDVREIKPTQVTFKQVAE